jgi:hypothetical protein
VFEYLCHKVKPTGDSVQVMVDKELPELVSRIKGDNLARKLGIADKPRE